MKGIHWYHELNIVLWGTLSSEQQSCMCLRGFRLTGWIMLHGTDNRALKISIHRFDDIITLSKAERERLKLISELSFLINWTEKAPNLPGDCACEEKRLINYTSMSAYNICERHTFSLEFISQFESIENSELSKCSLKISPSLKTFVLLASLSLSFCFVGFNVWCIIAASLIICFNFSFDYSLLQDWDIKIESCSTAASNRKSFAV